MATTLTQEDIRKIISEIKGSQEVNRRALAFRRHKIYRDGGKSFLIEQLSREFGEDAIPEMRLCPVNILKKLVDKKSGVYRKAPSRVANSPQNQALVDYYSETLKFNETMQKANRYFNLFANTIAYLCPDEEGKLKLWILPNYLYSVKAEDKDKTEAEFYILNAYTEEGDINPNADLDSATGNEAFSRDRGFKSDGDLIESNEKLSDKSRYYIFWSDEFHFTVNDDGVVMMDPSLGPEQLLNPMMEDPIVNIAKDRDNEFWSTEGDDMVDLTMQIQLGFSDLMSIAKNQGWGQLALSSIDEPKDLTFGLNRILWLKQSPDGSLPQPDVKYIQNNPPIQEYKELLLDLLGLLLTTNNLDPQTIGGYMAKQTFTSGFHALISMSDNIEQIQSDQACFDKIEKEIWEKLSIYHNFLFDSDKLPDEARVLGKFSDDFSLYINFPQIKPLESTQEKIADVKTLMELGLATKADALKLLNPDWTQEQIQEKLKELGAESVNRAQSLLQNLPANDQQMMSDNQMNDSQMMDLSNGQSYS